MRIADTLRACAVGGVAFAASKAALTIMYYVFPSGALATFKQLLDIAVNVWVLSSIWLRCAGPAVGVVAAWGGAMLVFILGVTAWAADPEAHGDAASRPSRPASAGIRDRPTGP